MIFYSKLNQKCLDEIIFCGVRVCVCYGSYIRVRAGWRRNSRGGSQVICSATLDLIFLRWVSHCDG